MVELILDWLFPRCWDCDKRTGTVDPCADGAERCMKCFQEYLKRMQENAT